MSLKPKQPVCTFTETVLWERTHSYVSGISLRAYLGFVFLTVLGVLLATSLTHVHQYMGDCFFKSRLSIVSIFKGPNLSSKLSNDGLPYCFIRVPNLK